MTLTRHAETRSQQRGIPRYVIEAIYAYGSPSYSRGALSHSLDRDALELAADDMTPDQVAVLHKYRNVYVVADGPNVLTVAHARRRRRSKSRRRRGSR